VESCKVPRCDPALFPFDYLFLFLLMEINFSGEISSKTKILCLKALGSKRFVLRKLFVVDIVLHEMETSKCATAVLDMVHKLSWPAKCVRKLSNT